MNSQHLNNTYTSAYFSQEQANYDDYVARVKSAYEFLKCTFEVESLQTSQCNDAKKTDMTDD